MAETMGVQNIKIQCSHDKLIKDGLMEITTKRL